MPEYAPSPQAAKRDEYAGDGHSAPVDHFEAKRYPPIDGKCQRPSGSGAFGQYTCDRKVSEKDTEGYRCGIHLNADNRSHNSDVDRTLNSRREETLRDQASEYADTLRGLTGIRFFGTTATFSAQARVDDPKALIEFIQDLKRKAQS